MDLYDGQAANYPYTVTVKTSHKKGESDRKRILNEDILTFDIETTSFFFEQDLKPFLYKPGYDPVYWTGVYAGSLPYLWQFGINGKYYYGRELKDITKVFDDIPKDMHCIIWVHNLSFEWHHLDFLHWTNVFAKSAHKPIKASCREYPNIQFRCTLSLENQSLASWGKSLGVLKREGDLVYNVLRTPLTPLTETELGYGQGDLEVMYAGLTKELKTYGSVWNIPMTSTGKIRRVCKDMLMADNDYKKFIKNLIPENPYQYDTSKKVYAGGYTHANRTKVNEVFYNEDGKHGGHYDYTSSYPYEMLVGKMPSDQWEWMPKELPDLSTFEEYGYKIHVVFHNLQSELQNTYISKNHCSCVNPKVDNGKISKADECDIWITEQDLEVINLAYSYDKEKTKVIECWRSKKEYLPIKFVQYVLQLFHDKTALKGVDDEAYALAKAYLNSLYGMCVTALLSATIEWKDDVLDWKIHRITPEQVSEHLAKLAVWRDTRYFLNFDWGVWISNGARCRLWKDIIIPYDKHILYADTDSAFTDITIDWTEYNKYIDSRVEKVCAERGLDVALTRPYSNKGKQSFIGRFTTEPEWTEFKTLGAKRYCERRKYTEGDKDEDGQLHLTVAGINKEAVSCLKNDINNFKNGCIFDKDEEDVTKLLHTYIDYMPDITFPDGYVSHQRRGVNLRPNGYKLKMDDSFDDLIDAATSGYTNEAYETQLKSVWYDDIDEIIENAFNALGGLNG